MSSGWDSIRTGETPVGLGANVYRASSYAYSEGGFAFRGRTPCAIIFTDAAGGGTGMYDPSTGKVKLYRAGAEVSGTLTALSVTVFTF